MSVLLSEHLPLLTTAPEGIEKLRHLILELAIRGRLVPQDGKDEPASELLTRITQERTRLEANGICKKSKVNVNSVNVAELPELPEGWIWTNLAKVALINPRNTADDLAEVSFVPMAMIGNRFEGTHLQESRKWVEVKQGFTHFSEGDIGVAKITPCFENSKACVFAHLRNGIGAGTTELHIIRPLGKMLAPRYVLAYLKAPMFLAVGETKMTGTAGQKRLPKDFLESNPFPLPPLAEQHRIVAKVDELMILCDRLEAEQGDAESSHTQLVRAMLGVLTQSTDALEVGANWQRLALHFDILFTTESSIEFLKQAVLQLAVMGKLVSQDSQDEPASELLKRVAQTRERLEAEGVCKKSKPTPPVDEEEQPYSLPNEWSWSSIGSIFGVTSSKRIFESDYVPRGVPFYRSKEIGELSKSGTTVASFFISEEKYTAVQDSREFPKPGDLLLTSVGSIGNTWIVDHRQFYFKDGNITQIIQSDLMCMRYLQRFIQSPLFMRQATETVSGTAYNALTIVKLKQMLIPIPPLAEQRRIVAKVDELMILCDRLKAELADSRFRHARLASTLIESALKAA